MLHLPLLYRCRFIVAFFKVMVLLRWQSPLVPMLTMPLVESSLKMHFLCHG